MLMSLLFFTFPRIGGGDPEVVTMGLFDYLPFPRIGGGDPNNVILNLNRFYFSPHRRG